MNPNRSPRSAAGLQYWAARGGRRKIAAQVVLALSAMAIVVPIAAGQPAAAAPSCPPPAVTGDHIGAAGWGFSQNGEVGNGSLGNVLSPGQVTGLKDNIVQVAAGDGEGAPGSPNHSMALTKDGFVWGWGSNEFGQIGDGTSTDRATPVQVSGITCVTQISAGQRFSLALKGDGTVWSWGSNQFGELGTGGGDTAAPVQISGLSGITQIDAGIDYALARRQDGTVLAWGRNEFGALGDGTTTERDTPVHVVGLSSGVIQIAAGAGDSYAVRADGTLVGWGFNVAGDLGIGSAGRNQTAPVMIPGLREVVQVSSGFAHGLALLSDGTVRSWGLNNRGQLGDGSTTNRTKPVVVQGVSNVTQVSAGNRQSLALRADHTVLAWGDNTFGQMGDGTTNGPDEVHGPAPVPGLADVRFISAGSEHNLAVREVPPVKTSSP